MYLITMALDAQDYMLPCLSKKLLDMDCPGCGLQRSMAFLFEGDFIAAFKMYPAIYTLISLFGFLFANLFFKIKHANTIVIALTTSSVFLILTNYFLKLI